MDDVFAGTYGVELICRERPEIAKASLLRSLRRWCPGVEPIDQNEQAGLLGFVHSDHPIRLADARLAAQTLVVVSDGAFSPDRFSGALQQTWDFDSARKELATCSSSVLVTDFMSGSLEYRERIDVFQRALRAVLEAVPCALVHWMPSQRIVEPAAWMKAFDAGDAAQLFGAGVANVRLFDASERAPGELVMDTLGLGALGLPDLQCHFTQLDPPAVARVLYNTAWYIFERGDVIQDGNTAQGVTPDSKWACQHVDALVGPDRVVLDMNPGPPYAPATPGTLGGA